jgi:hypothetical protein
MTSDGHSYSIPALLTWASDSFITGTTIPRTLGEEAVTTAELGRQPAPNQPAAGAAAKTPKKRGLLERIYNFGRLRRATPQVAADPPAVTWDKKRKAMLLIRKDVSKLNGTWKQSNFR